MTCCRYACARICRRAARSACTTTERSFSRLASAFWAKSSSSISASSALSGAPDGTRSSALLTSPSEISLPLTRAAMISWDFPFPQEHRSVASSTATAAWKAMRIHASYVIIPDVGIRRAAQRFRRFHVTDESAAAGDRRRGAFPQAHGAAAYARDDAVFGRRRPHGFVVIRFRSAGHVPGPLEERAVFRIGAPCDVEVISVHHHPELHVGPVELGGVAKLLQRAGIAEAKQVPGVRLFLQCAIGARPDHPHRAEERAAGEDLAEERCEGFRHAPLYAWTGRIPSAGRPDAMSRMER